MNIIHLVSNKVWGGGERYVLDLADASRRRGCNVEVFTRKRPAVADVFEKKGLLAGTLMLGGVFDIFSPIRLAKHLDKLEGRTIVHAHNFKDAYTALAARKLCQNASEIRIVCTRHLARPAKISSLNQRTYSELDAIIFVSQTTHDYFMSTKPAIDSQRSHIVHNCILDQAAETVEKSHDGEPVRLIFAGRIVPEKGLDVLINALGELKDYNWQLEVCGTGKGRDVMPIVRAARSLGINDRIKWSGHVDNVTERMDHADIGIFPSTWVEPFGLTILEAFSQNLAVISTNQGGPAEIICNGENGLLVPAKDYKALADAIKKLLNNPDLRHKIADNGLKSFKENYNYDKFVDKIFAIYNEC